MDNFKAFMLRMAYERYERYERLGDRLAEIEPLIDWARRLIQ